MLKRTEAETVNYLDRLGQKLESCGRGQKGELIEAASKELGWSRNKIYAELKSLGWGGQRKRRTDRGNASITEDEAKLLSNLMQQSKRDTGKQLIPLQVAIDQAYANGWLSNKISVATATRAMRRYKVHPDQINAATPFKSLRSLHPNHAWQFDVSVCVLFYLRNEDGLRVMPKDEFYKNKPENLEKVANDRVLRYLITDHYSAAFYVEYFQSPGESADILFEFLMNAFRKRHDQDPVHGLPKLLIWDKGSANTSHKIKHLLSRLTIDEIAHQAGNPRAKGQVESTHNLIERHFEGRLSFFNVSNLDELNDKAYAWARYYNSHQKMTRHGHTRYGFWQTIRAEQLRLAPSREQCEQILQNREPMVRVVRGDLTITYAMKGKKSLSYSVADIPEIAIGDKVKVYDNPFRAPNADVIVEDAEGNATTYECPPVEVDAAGFPLDAPVVGEDFASAIDTVVDKNRKAMNKAAYGVETEQEVKAKRKAKTPAFEHAGFDAMADVKQAQIPAYMRRKGTQYELEADNRQAEKLSHLKALKQIKAELDVPPEVMQTIKHQLKVQYPEGVTHDELNTYLQQVRKTYVNAQAATI